MSSSPSLTSPVPPPTSSSTWTPVVNGTSAFVGNPPNTQRDYWIVAGLLRAIGYVDTDPAEGYVVAALTKDQTPSPYDSKRPAVLAGLITVIVAIVFITGTRLVLRASVSHMRFGTDDWATMAAAGMGLAYTICQLIMAINGGGDHTWDHTYEQYYTFNHLGVLDQLFFYLTVALIKTSLTLFIRRLADRASRKWRWFCDFFLFSLVVYIIMAIFWFCFTCSPPQAYWDVMYRGSLPVLAVTCIDTTVQGRFLNITHVVQGVILLASPVVILWKIKMEIKKKIRLFIIWAVGLLVVLCGLMRLVRADFTSDVMWSYTSLLVWTAMDVAVGIMVISMPVVDAWLAGGVRKAMTKMGATTHGATMGKSGYGNLDKSSGLGTMKSHRTVGTKSGVHIRSSNKDSTDSDEEGMMDRRNDGFEMGIIRTDEYMVQYHSVEPAEAANMHRHASPVDEHEFPGAAR